MAQALLETESDWKWIWVSKLLGHTVWAPRNPHRSVVSGFGGQLSEMSQEVDPGSSASCTATFTFVYLTPLLPVPSPSHRVGCPRDKTRTRESKSANWARVLCTPKEARVLGHRLKLSGQSPARPWCQGEREFQVSGARARHRVTTHKGGKRRSQVTNCKIQGYQTYQRKVQRTAYA